MFALIKFVLAAVWFLLTIGVLVNVWRNPATSMGHKLLWTAGVLFFPVLGPVAFILFGERN